ncbi:hypothetical protein A2U01_0035646, partial [Trifolium medium]|nr:hypothetical protein [Trifolium medium]
YYSLYCHMDTMAREIQKWAAAAMEGAAEVTL